MTRLDVVCFCLFRYVFYEFVNDTTTIQRKSRKSTIFRATQDKETHENIQDKQENKKEADCKRKTQANYNVSEM